MTPIEIAIQEMFEQKVFTLEGIKAVQQLRENFSKLTDDYAGKLVELRKANELNSSLATQNEDLVAKVSEVRNRELAVKKREKEMTRLEITTEFTKKMQENTLDMFNTIFANAALKTSVMRSVAIPVQGHPGNSQMGSYPMAGTVLTTPESETTIKEVD